MMDQVREKVINELERVVQCREYARCHWRHNPAKDIQTQDARLTSLAQFNEAILACKEALVHNSGDLMLKALALTERTP